jgi:uncharacterized cupredoxin-like copper-binding protein
MATHVVAGSVAAMTNIRTGGFLISLAVAGLLSVAACGSSGSSGSGSSGTTAPAGSLVVEAEDIHFDKKAYEAPAGEVTIDYVSKGQILHDLVIYDKDNKVVGHTLRVTPGQKKVGTFDLPAGTYTLICDIPGHREAGMVATLTTK